MGRTDTCLTCGPTGSPLLISRLAFILPNSPRAAETGAHEGKSFHPQESCSNNHNNSNKSNNTSVDFNETTIIGQLKILRP